MCNDESSHIHEELNEKRKINEYGVAKDSVKGGRVQKAIEYSIGGNEIKSNDEKE